MADRITFKVRRDGGLWHGEINLPYGPPAATYMPQARAKLPQQITVAAKDATQAGAMTKAAGLAEQLLSNPIVAAALPPGTTQAIGVLKAVGAGDAVKAAGAGAKRLASALKFW